jgi:hypothetical protein
MQNLSNLKKHIIKHNLNTNNKTRKIFVKLFSIQL